MKQALYLSLFIFITSSTSLRSQSLPKIEIGSIVSLTYKNSESGESPLKVNDGDGTFLNQWILLLGADINENLSLYAEIQTVRGIRLFNYGLSAIYQPRKWRYLNFEVGKFLVPFGTFLSRRWASENPFIDFPLLYEYRTGISAFDIPKNENELLHVRGHGRDFQYHTEISQTQLNKLSATFSGHLPVPGSGLRIISREVYLTGLQIFGTGGPFSYNLGVTNGALSNPVDINNSNGVQVHGRVSFNPIIGLALGSSFSQGIYLAKESVNSQLDTLGKTVEDFRQTAVGLDVSYSIGHIVFFSEFIRNRWQTPFINEDLDAIAFYLEGKYTFLTRFYLAGRFSSIDFAHINDSVDVDSDGQLKESWDFDIQQFELGLGCRLNRNALIKVVAQFNRTKETLTGDPADDLFAFQTVVFF